MTLRGIPVDEGWVVLLGAVSDGGIATIRTALDAMEGGPSRLKSLPAAAYGVLALPSVQECLRAAGAGDSVLVRAVSFDKSGGHNWFVPWHQDTVVPLAERPADEPEGWTHWTEKDGIPHARAPVEWLERMVTVRVALDDADESNGALEFVPGSHRLGVLEANEAGRVGREGPTHLCTMAKGDVLLMRPLLVHRSGKVRPGGESEERPPRRRGVLHLELGAPGLPAPLRWPTVAGAMPTSIDE